jgi:hypothetical protein
MLPAIDFDDESTVETDEVDDVVAERKLTPEQAIMELTLSDSGPQFAFGVSHLPA